MLVQAQGRKKGAVWKSPALSYAAACSERQRRTTKTRREKRGTRKQQQRLRSFHFCPAADSPRSQRAGGKSREHAVTSSFLRAFLLDARLKAFLLRQCVRMRGSLLRNFLIAHKIWCKLLPHLRCKVLFIRNLPYTYNVLLKFSLLLFYLKIDKILLIFRHIPGQIRFQTMKFTISKIC